MSSCVFLLKPICLNFYVKKEYEIVFIKSPPKDAIKNQWSGLAQHVAVAVTNSIDNIMLTLFGTFSMISIYNVYVSPLNSIRNLVEVTSNSYKSYFGNIIAEGDKNTLCTEFYKYETNMHYIIDVIMSTTLVTLVPFVLMYTQGVHDTNYKNYIFCVSITAAYVMIMLRMIYTNVIFAAGKFRETRNYCIIECILNVILSFILVKPFGLSGVAIGTVVSSGYRMVVSAYYLTIDILYRPIKPFIVHILVDLSCFFSVGGISCILYTSSTSFIGWALYASVIFGVSILVCTMIHLIVYSNEMIGMLKCLIKVINRIGPANKE